MKKGYKGNIDEARKMRIQITVYGRKENVYGWQHRIERNFHPSVLENRRMKMAIF